MNFTKFASDPQNAIKGANGEALFLEVKDGFKFVALEAKAFQELQEAMAFLKLVTQSQAQIDVGEFYTLDEFKKKVSVEIIATRREHETV